MIERIGARVSRPITHANKAQYRLYRMPQFFMCACFALSSLASSAASDPPPRAEPASALASTSSAASATSRRAEAAFSRGDALPAWVQPLREVAASKRSDAFVLRLAHTQFWLGPQPAVLVHRVMQANESSALGRIGQIPINFVPEYQTAVLHSLKVQRGTEITDRTRSVSIRFVDSEPGLEQGVYAGNALANLLIEDLRVADVVHVTYSVIGNNPVFQGAHFDIASWDRTDATDLRVVEMVAPQNQLPVWRMVGETGFKRVRPKESLNANLSVLSFAEEDLPTLVDEPQVPSDVAPYRYLQFSSYRSWSDVARWAQALFPPVSELPAEMGPIIERAKALPTPEERASSALRWVQSQIRYFSVSFGESSHRPYAPKEVIKRRYGDCKDKSYLLVTMLQAMGIEARAVLVSAAAPRTATLLLPSPMAFDHVIVEITLPSGKYYVDPTRQEQRTPLATLPPPLYRGVGLIADARSSELLTLPGPTAAMTESTLEEQITIKSFDQPPTLVSRNTLSGLAAEVIRLGWSQMKPEQRHELINGSYVKRYTGAKAVGEPELEDDLVNNRITLKTKLTLHDAVREREGDRGITYLPENFGGFFAIPAGTTRTAPAVVGTVASSARYQVTVEWPENVSRTLDPSVTKTDNEFFASETERQFRGNTFSLRASIRSKVAVVDAVQLPAFREEIRKFESSLGSVSFVPSGSVQAKGFLGLGKDTLVQRMRRDYERRIEGTSTAIKAGKLAGEDLADAHCERGIAAAFLRDVARAKEDADAAVKIAPSSGEMHACRGNIRFGLGEFAPAIADYSKALSLGASPGEAYYRRGHVRFYAGQYAGAAADFEQAADAKFTADGSGAAHYAQLWLLWSLQRAGKPIPEKLQATIAAEADGKWPRSALAMTLGLKSPEAILAEVNRLKGDERDMNLSEAYFYVGQYWLARKDAEKARVAFEASREKGIVMYIEHMASGHELDALKRSTPP